MNKIKMNIAVLADKLVNTKWLLNNTAYNNLSKMVMTYMANPTYMEVEESEYIPSPLTDGIITEKVTAVININGILVKGASNAECTAFGLMDVDYIRHCLEDAVTDDSVTEILLNINSPGGEVTGIEELGRKIQQIDKIKPIYAWTESMMCSAAYWLGSQCRKIGMTPSAIVGSIGVYSLIEDTSKALEQEGINIQAISAGKYKLLGANFKPLSDEERKILQDDVSNQHTKFKNAVLSSRKIDMEFMEGLSYEGVNALSANLVDVVVDDIEKYITSLTSQDIHNMNLEDNKQAVVVTTEVKAEVPGVPTDDKKAEYDGGYAECPHCGKKLSDPVEPHKEPDGDEVEPADNKDEKKMAVVPSVKFDMSIENWNKQRGIANVETNKFVLSAYKSLHP